MECCLQDFFNKARSILVPLLSSFFSICLVSIHVVHPYSSIDSNGAWEKVHFILSDRSDLHMINMILWLATLCLSSFPDAQPEAQVFTLLYDGFLYCILSATSLDSNSSEPQCPFGLMWLSLPHLVNNSFWSPTATLLTSVLTELYNSSTPYSVANSIFEIACLIVIKRK